jgi:hypothetical protein
MNHILKMSNAGGFTSTTRYPDMLAGNTVWNPYTTVGSYDSLASITVGATAQASITFSNIPQTYTHLELRCLSKNTAAGGDSYIRINSNTQANYRHQFYGDGSSATGSSASGEAYILFTAGSGGTSTFGADIISILDYTNTNKNKTVCTLSGRDLNGSGVVGINSALFTITAAVSDITLTSAGTSFATNSSFALYGVKA